MLSLRKILCLNCKTEITNYYSPSYEGKRATCPICRIDFPLE